MFRKSDTSQRRSSLDITADILRIAWNGAKKTRVVYGANLNFKLLNEYLFKLKEAGLVTYSSEDRLIETTAKGREYLKQFDILKDSVKRIWTEKFDGP